MSQLAARLAEQTVSGALKFSERVTERGLADRMRVSPPPPPIRGALALLKDRGLLEDMDEGDSRIAADIVERPAEPIPLADDEAVYFQIADDRLKGALPDRVTESELLRRYPVTRGKL